jgi:hypothetical protein
MKKYYIKFTLKGSSHETTVDAKTESEARKLVSLQYGSSITIWTVKEIK